MSRKDEILSMREVLVRRRDALRKALLGDMGLMRELRDQANGDSVDEAHASIQDELNLQLAEVETRELDGVEHALMQMREGNYGICEGCGTSIPTARLKALPYAIYCIKCQCEAESKGAAPGAMVNWGKLLDSSDNDSDLSLEDIEPDKL